MLLGYDNRLAWISGSDLAKEGEYVWLGSGRPMAYKNFANNQPDNAGGNENCVQMLATGKWNDINCNTQLDYICQYSNCC